MKESSTGLSLPPAVRAAALDALGTSELRHELAWMSWAGTVWRLEAESRSVYVKRAADLAGERDRLQWLDSRWPVPKPIGLYRAFGDDWLLTHAVVGVPLSDKSIAWSAARMAAFMGETLRNLHAVDATGCPFGEARPGHVLMHGDYCMPNVLVHADQLSAVVDVGQSGWGDPSIDLAAGVWTLQYNFGPGHAREFLDAYGAARMTDAAIERLRRKYAR